MTDQQHPITPSPELAKQWLGEYFGCTVNGELNDSERFLTTRAAQWGADQELDACCRELAEYCDCGVELTSGHVRELLMELRRPKPPSLAEEAIQQLDDAVMRGDCITTTEAMPALRRAPERLQQLENQQ